MTMPKTIARAAAATRIGCNGDQFDVTSARELRSRRSRFSPAKPPPMTRTTSPASGRYIRRSAATSVGIGTTSVGERMAKNQMPR